MNPDRIASIISGHRYRFSSEEQLHDGIAHILATEGIDFTREYRLSAKDRVDFMAGGTAIEVKTGSARSEVLRQIYRYSEHDEVEAIILVSTKASHLGMPAQLNGKPVYVASLLGGAF